MSIFHKIRRRFFKNEYEKLLDDKIVPKFKRLGQLMDDGERLYIYLDDRLFAYSYCHAFEFIKHNSKLIMFHLAGPSRYIDGKKDFIQENSIYLNDFGATNILEDFRYDLKSNEYSFDLWECRDVWEDRRLFQSRRPEIDLDEFFNKLNLLEVKLL